MPEEKLSFAEKETDAPDKLQLFANDHIYVLYGTDSIVLGKKVADQVRTLLIAKNKEEGEADEN